MTSLAALISLKLKWDLISIQRSGQSSGFAAFWDSVQNIISLRLDVFSDLGLTCGQQLYYPIKK